MSTFYTDFSSNTEGVFPSDWNVEYLGDGTGTRAIVTNPVTGKKEFKFTQAGGGTYGGNELTYTPAGTAADSETLILATMVSGAGLLRSYVRYSYVNPDFYSTNVQQYTSDTGPTFQLLRANSSLTALSSNTYETGIAKTDTFWIRTRVTGTTVQNRVWEYGTTEPTAWRSTVTDSVVTSSGKVGFQYAKIDAATAMDIRIHYFAVGTAGDKAPYLLEPQNSLIGLDSTAPQVDVPGQAGYLIFGGWGTSVWGASYPGSGLTQSSPEIGAIPTTIGISSTSPILIVDITLSVQNSTIGISSTSPTLVESVGLTVADSTIGISSSQPVLEPGATLVPSNSTIGITSDNAFVDATVSVAIGQDSYIGISSDNVTLAQTHHLTVQDSTIGVSSTVPTMVLDISLLISDSIISLSSPEVLFFQDYQLFVQNSDIALSDSGTSVGIQFPGVDVDNGVFQPRDPVTGEILVIEDIENGVYQPRKVPQGAFATAEAETTGSWEAP